MKVPGGTQISSQKLKEIEDRETDKHNKLLEEVK